jgi:cytochrome c553
MILRSLLALSLARDRVQPRLPKRQGRAKGDAARKAQPIASAVCGACHGADGNSVAARSTRSWPASIPNTCYKQMKNFKAADGKQPERVNGRS